MPMGPQAGPRGPMGSGSLGMGAMNNSLMPGGMVSISSYSNKSVQLACGARLDFYLDRETWVRAQVRSHVR